MTDLHVKALGQGTPAVLVHGSGGGCDSWSEQHALAARFRLLLPDRRGYGHSPRAARIDCETDAVDIADLLGNGAHLVGQSYGGVGSLLAAARRPEAVISLAVLEPPILGLVRVNPEADGIMERLTRVYDTMQAATPEEFDAAFDTALGFPRPPAPLTPESRMAVESMMKERLPFDTHVPFDRLAEAPFPKLVVSGGWSPVFTAVCDELARRIRAERAVVRGAGHAIHRAGKPFNELLEALWNSVKLPSAVR